MCKETKLQLEALWFHKTMIEVHRRVVQNNTTDYGVGVNVNVALANGGCFCFKAVQFVVNNKMVQSLQQYAPVVAAVRTSRCSSTHQSLQQYAPVVAAVRTSCYSSTHQSLQQYALDIAAVRTSRYSSTHQSLQQYAPVVTAVRTSRCSSMHQSLQQYASVNCSSTHQSLQQYAPVVAAVRTSRCSTTHQSLQQCAPVVAAVCTSCYSNMHQLLQQYAPVIEALCTSCCISTHQLLYQYAPVIAAEMQLVTAVTIIQGPCHEHALVKDTTTELQTLKSSTNCRSIRNSKNTQTSSHQVHHHQLHRGVTYTHLSHLSGRWADANQEHTSHIFDNADLWRIYLYITTPTSSLTESWNVTIGTPAGASSGPTQCSRMLPPSKVTSTLSAKCQLQVW